VAKTFTLTGMEVKAFTEFDEAVQLYMKAHDVRAGALSMVRDGRLVYARAYTFAEPDYPITQPTSLFRVASCSKSLTAIAILQLVERGVLDLDDLVAPMLERKVKPPQGAEARPEYLATKVRHLLSHTSGLPHGTAGAQNTMADEDFPSTKYKIAGIAISQQYLFEPGTTVQYSNFGYWLLGMVIEAKVGGSYDAAVQRFVFGPAGVTRAFVGESAKHLRAPKEVFYHDVAEVDGKNPLDKSRLEPTRPMVERPYGGEFNLKLHDASGGWALSAPDYARVLAALQFGTESPLFKQRSPQPWLEFMQAPDTEASAQIGSQLPGWDLAVDDDVNTYQKGGGISGTHSRVAYRSDNTAYVIVFNKNSPNKVPGHFEDFFELPRQLIPAVQDWPAHDLFPAMDLPPADLGPRSVSWGKNRLDVLRKGSKGRVRHKAWEGKNWSPPNPKYEDLNGEMVGLLDVVSWGPNRLDIFVRGRNGGVYHKAWSGQWFPGATTWENLKGSVVGPLRVVSWGKNRLDVFMRDFRGGLRHKAWDGQHWFPGVNTWEGLGGDIVGSFEVIAPAPKRLNVVVQAPSGAVLHKAWTGKNWSPAEQEWENLSGDLVGPLTTVSWGPDRLDIFGAAVDGRVLHKARAGDQWFPSPATWEDLGGKVLGPVEAVAWAPNRLDVFVRGTDAALWHKAWDGGAWVPAKKWECLGGELVGPFRAISWGPKRLDVFTRDSAGALFHKALDGNTWSPSGTKWESLGGNTVGPLDVVSWGPERLDLFADQAGGGIVHKAFAAGKWFPSQGGWESLGLVP
jgi:CubicO group peptidase (beta-lactamase class C family)